MKRTSLALIAILTLATGVAACGGSEEASPPPAPESEAPAPGSSSDTTDPGAASGTVTVSGSEFAFDPSTLELPADTPTIVEFTNDGGIEHDFTVEGYEADRLIATAGQTQTGNYTLPAGSYRFYCSIPGHEAAGMVGTIEVS